MIELTTDRDNRDEILELLRFCVDGARTRPGCLSSGIYEGNEENGAILYLERWKSEKDLHRHIQSNLYRGVLNAMDLAEEPRRITFHQVTSTESLGLIVALRGNAKSE